MKIAEVLILPTTLDKIIWKHQVNEAEVRQVFCHQPMIVFLEKGRVKNEHLYAALGQTNSGRYLTIFFIHKINKNALVVTARDMNPKERKRYAKK